jgi:AcrR family transcriptional regulator
MAARTSPSSPAAADRRSSEGTATRQQVIDAAVETIVEVGFDLASSREILRRAGYTWGVLQYHFGSRESLLLAVLQDSADRFTELLSSVTIADGPPADRLEALLTILDSHYGSPQYVAALEIIFNLSHNPATRAKTLEVLHDLAERSRAPLFRLMRDVVGPGADDSRVEHVIFHLTRGFSLSHVLADLLEYGDGHVPTSPEEMAAERKLLAGALASLLPSAG